MGRAALRHEELKKAVSTLREALEEPFTVIVRDAVIQRFEYSFELCWKWIRDVLDETHGLNCQSPKGCFRELHTLQIVTEEEAETLLAMTDDRNATSHMYNENMVNKIFGRVRDKYFPLMALLLNRIQEAAAVK